MAEQISDETEIDLERMAKLLGKLNDEHKENKDKPFNAKEVKLFTSIDSLNEALHIFKDEDIFEDSDILNSFKYCNKLVYEQYDFKNLDKIQINSNNVFIHFIVNPKVPLIEINEVVSTLCNNVYPKQNIHIKNSTDINEAFMRFEVIYSLGDKLLPFNEDELIDMYNCLKILDKNSILQTKIKKLLEKGV